MPSSDNSPRCSPTQRTLALVLHGQTSYIVVEVGDDHYLCAETPETPEMSLGQYAYIDARVVGLAMSHPPAFWNEILKMSENFQHEREEDAKYETR